MAGQTLDNTQTIPWVFRAWQTSWDTREELGLASVHGGGLQGEFM